MFEGIEQDLLDQHSIAIQQQNCLPTQQVFICHHRAKQNYEWNKIQEEIAEFQRVWVEAATKLFQQVPPMPQVSVVQVNHESPPKPEIIKEELIEPYDPNPILIDNLKRVEGREVS
jgi:hypothetical protein